MQVYNLPETVRESDVEKLSFAVQLAEGFYAASQVQGPPPMSVTMHRSPRHLCERWSLTCSITDAAVVISDASSSVCPEQRLWWPAIAQKAVQQGG